MKIHCLVLGRSAAALLVALAPQLAAAGVTTSTTSSTSLESTSSSSSSSSTSLTSSSTSVSSSSSSSTSVSSSSSSSTSVSSSSSSSTTTASSSTTSTTQSTACAIDAYFVYESAFNDLAEVTSGQLAQTSGQASQVQEFGQRMVTDHCAHLVQLDDASASAGIDLPPAFDLTPCDKGSPTGAFVGSRDFDLTYLRTQITGHRRAIDLNKREAKSGCDSGLKALATTTIPLLQQHLTQAKQALRRVRAQGGGGGAGAAGTGGGASSGAGSGAGGGGSSGTGSGVGGDGGGSSGGGGSTSGM